MAKETKRRYLSGSKKCSIQKVGKDRRRTKPRVLTADRISLSKKKRRKNPSKKASLSKDALAKRKAKKLQKLREERTVETTSGSAEKTFSTVTRSPKKKAVLTVFDKWKEETVACGVNGIRREFVYEIKDFVPSGTTEAFNAEENVEKNRYTNIRLLDCTRVRLRNCADGDYIHASLVTSNIDFICTQGPMTNTVEHFWIMIVEANSKVVIQLCSRIEDYDEKCCDYYPSKGSLSFGSVTVKFLERNARVASSIQCTKLFVSSPQGSVKVMHLFFKEWPDRTVPTSAKAFLELRHLYWKHCEKQPVVVHCSAGVGRSGTLIAVEMVYQKLRKMKKLQEKVVRDVTKQLRRQRMGAVQNDKQYLFVYWGVLELLVSEGDLPKDQEILDFIGDCEAFIERKRKVPKA